MQSLVVSSDTSAQLPAPFMSGRARHPTPGPRSVMSESEEYDDSFASDSETDQAVSSRTESSNPRDHERSATALSVHHSK